MPDRVGVQYGNYRLVRLLGQGGFAEVYLGEHVHLHTQAAIKVLQAHLNDQEAIENFTKEARIIAQLIHPHIIRTLDFGVEGNVPYLVMDYAPNGSLRQVLPKGEQLPLARILPYVKQVADALDYAHSLRIIHRDIKPENMLVGRRGEVLLSDFGIAIMAQSSRYQNTQDMAGTIAYMAPEQIQGRPKPASDQYALAVVVYEWLSGRRLFQGTFSEIAAQHSMGTPAPLRGYAQVSEQVEQVVMRALAKNPAERFPSVTEFALALEQAYKGEYTDTQRKGTAPTVGASNAPAPAQRPLDPTVAASSPSYSQTPSQPSLTTQSPYYPPPPPASYPPNPYGYPPQQYPSQYNNYRPPQAKAQGPLPLLRGAPKSVDLPVLLLYSGAMVGLLVVLITVSYASPGPGQVLPPLIALVLMIFLPGSLFGSWRAAVVMLVFVISLMIALSAISNGIPIPAYGYLYFGSYIAIAWFTGFLSERRKRYNFLVSWGLFALELLLLILVSSTIVHVGIFVFRAFGVVFLSDLILIIVVSLILAVVELIIYAIVKANRKKSAS